MSRILTIREFILLNRRCLHTGGYISSGSPNLQQQSGSNQKLTHKHVQRTLEAIRTLVVDNSDASKKIKRVLGTDDSWARPAGVKRPAMKKSKREREPRASSVSGNPTLPISPLLQPYEVSAKVQELAKEGKLEEAIDWVTNLPVDALNVQAWNTLIWEANKAKKFKVAWEIFNQMKKKGFEPSTYSYKTMLNGVVRIDDFRNHSQSLERAHKLYASFIQYTSRLREERADHPELHPVPIHFYMAILVKAGLRGKMWEVFYAMDKQGPMAPNAVTFASMLQHIDWRTPDETTPMVEWNHRVASDASLIWRLLLSSARRTKFEIDSHVIATVLRHLAKGRSAEHDLAFDIVHHHLGLKDSSSSPTDGPSSSQAPALKSKTSLTEFTLQSALELCRLSGKPGRAVEYMKQVMNKGDESVVDIHNMDQLFKAYFDMAMSAPESSTASPSDLKPSQQAKNSLEWLLSHAATYFSVDRSEEERKRHLWPTLRTYNLILATCRECKDWDSTRKTLEMMTGIKMPTLAPKGASVTSSAGSGGDPLPLASMLRRATDRFSYQRRQYFRPTVESLFDIMHCARGYAVEHNKPSTAHECLSTINALDGTELLTESFASSRKALYDLVNHPHPKESVVRLDQAVKREEERKKHWAIRASAIVPALFSLATKSGGWNRKEYAQAVRFREAATTILNTQRHELTKEKSDKPL